MAHRRSVVILAPNSFARFLGSAVESQFQLLLKDGVLASLHNLDLLLNSPLKSPRLDNGFKETNPMAGYYLESFLRLQGYEARTVFDWSDDSELDNALRSEPLAIALSTTYITDTELLSRCLESLRARAGSVPIVVGGPFIWKQKIELTRDHSPERRTQMARFGVDILADCLFGHCDRPILQEPIYVAHEFGEHTLVRVLSKLAEGRSTTRELVDIPNLVLALDDGSWYVTPSAPEPVAIDECYTRWDLVDDMPAMVPIRASVGCPYRCRYCDFIELHPTVIMRSADSLASEMELARTRGGRFFGFIDDNIFLSKKRIAQITHTLLDRELDVIWGGFFRVDRIDEANIDDLAASGCRFGLCGIESGDDAQLKRMNKGCNREEARRGIELAVAAGMNLNLSLLVGFPGETDETIGSTIEYLNSLPTACRGFASWLAYPFYLLPSTGADEPDFRKEFRLTGRRANWEHATMSYADAVGRWAPEMFRRIVLPYHYYAGDAPRWWPVARREEGFALRRRLTEGFLDRLPSGEIQERFAALIRFLAERERIEGGVPHWNELLAERGKQPGERAGYGGAFSQ